MKITLRDYKTNEFVDYEDIVDVGVYILARPSRVWDKEYSEALYFINNADAMDGVIADDWTDDYDTPIRPYMTYEVSQ
jgi:hypothetical protein